MKAISSVAISLMDRSIARTTRAATAVYTVPALAAVGLTEAVAKAKGLPAEVHVNHMHDWFSARTYAETVAWSKVIVDRASDRILGAHFVGHAGHELASQHLQLGHEIRHSR
jgi:pyruvate/2-oxoglutarate dehydrogenase complex dihydrolipoamide dehydrogenase (E3) component